MDQTAIDTLHEEGIDVSLTTSVPLIPIVVDDAGRVVPVGQEVSVLSGDHAANVTLKRISALFTGNTQPPDFAHGPTEGYVFFFAMLERVAVDYGESTGRIEKDVEFERCPPRPLVAAAWH